MATLKDILTFREKEMLQHYHMSILSLDIEDTATFNLYQKELLHIFEEAKKRYYCENPDIISINREFTDNIGPLTVLDLLTKEEKEEIDFLKWRMIKSFTTWGKRRNESKIEKILAEAKSRNGY